MAKIGYNRYSSLKTNGIVPFVKLPNNSTDKYINWSVMDSRYDKISEKYYGNPFYDIFLILGNSDFVSEYDIPDGTLIRIPFPLAKVKADYEEILLQQINQ